MELAVVLIAAGLEDLCGRITSAVNFQAEVEPFWAGSFILICMGGSGSGGSGSVGGDGGGDGGGGEEVAEHHLIVRIIERVKRFKIGGGGGRGSSAFGRV